MTNESISGFLNSIAEAKRAFDAEPEHLQRIADLEQDQRRLGETVAARELRIHSLKQDNDALLQKLRSVEAERDDAGFRALEEADKVQNLLSVVHSVINDALKTVSAVEGYEQIVVNKADRQRELDYANSLQDRAVELENELQSLRDDMRLAQEQLTRPFATPPATSSSQGEDTAPLYPKEPKDLGQRVADPFANTASSSSPQSLSVSSASAAPVDGVHTTTGEDPFLASGSDPIPLGLGNESVRGPISNAIVSNVSAPAVDSGIGTQEGQSDGPFAAPQSKESETVSSTIADTSMSAPSNASPPERNRDRSTFFTGRKYFDVTYFVPLHQWLNDGGTREDYYWRPAEANVPLPEASQASQRS